MDTDKVFRGLYITPHKISLLILISKYLGDAELSADAKQDLALFVVNEIKVRDLQVKIMQSLIVYFTGN